MRYMRENTKKFRRLAKRSYHIMLLSVMLPVIAYIIIIVGVIQWNTPVVLATDTAISLMSTIIGVQGVLLGFIIVAYYFALERIYNIRLSGSNLVFYMKEMKRKYGDGVPGLSTIFNEEKSNIESGKYFTKSAQVLILGIFMVISTSMLMSIILFMRIDSTMEYLTLENTSLTYLSIVMLVISIIFVGLSFFGIDILLKQNLDMMTKENTSQFILNESPK